MSISLKREASMGHGGESRGNRSSVSVSSVSVESVRISGSLGKVKSTSVSSAVYTRSSITIGNMLDNIREVGSSGVSMCNRTTVSSITYVAVSSISSVSIESICLSSGVSHATDLRE